MITLNRGQARVIVMAVALVLVVGCASVRADPGLPDASAAVPLLRPTVLAEIPHDTKAYTEGLEFDGPALYEGTGQAGQSQLRELDPVTGAVRRAVALPDRLFGEGITVVDDWIWQLTYMGGVAIKWDKATFTPLGEFPVDGDGWGLCRDGNRLIRSDGSSRLRFHDPVDFAVKGSVTVTRDGAPVTGLNELECVDGQAWANVWPSDQIVRIDPATGAVTAVVDAAGLLDSSRRARTDVLSGIAYAGAGEFLLTGKYWPTTFRVRFDSAR